MCLQCFASSCVLCLLVFSGSLLRAEEKEKKFIYQVMGSSQQSNEIRAWSTTFDTKNEANIRLAELKKDYGPGGLLESSTDKPVNLEVVEFEVTSSGQIIEKKIPAPEPPLLGGKASTITKPELAIVDPGPIKKPELKGKKYVGEINGDKVTLDFGDGDVQVSGGRTGTAKYSVLITKFLMQSERNTYEGTIEGDKISGTFKSIDGTKSGTWSVTLVDKRLFDYVGKFEQGTPGGYSGHEEVVLNADGTGTFTSSSVGSFEKYNVRWSVNGDGWVVVTGWSRIAGGDTNPYKPTHKEYMKLNDGMLVRVWDQTWEHGIKGEAKQGYRPLRRQ